MKKLSIALVVAALHIGFTIVLYRERFLHHRVQSDITLFLMPFLVASAGYYLVLTFKSSFKIRFASVFAAPLCAFLSLSVAMLYVLNAYGS